MAISSKPPRDNALDSLEALYAKPLPSSRSGPLYNAFSYPTKISPEAIAVFIATHTRPGSVVLDVFGGSGTTGLAALLCDKPTDEMRRMAAELGVAPAWGPRKAEIYELSTLGSFVASTLCAPPDPEVFDKAAKKLIAAAEEAFGAGYEALDPEGNPGKIRHVIWSDVLVCPNCGGETPYWKAAVRRSPLRLDSSFECGGCGASTQIDACSRAVEKRFDPLLGREIESKKRVPAQIYGRSAAGNWNRDPIPADDDVFRVSETSPLPPSAPVAEIFRGDLYRAGYHTGITHLHHFYTARNFRAVSILWELVGTFPESVRDALKLVVLSYNASHSTLMTRVVVKAGQTDLVLTGAQSGVLYVSGLPVEKNVFEGLRRKASALKKAFQAVSGSGSEVRVTNASSASLALADGSVDYVFTDPPFGDYIPYAEINQINEIWLGRTTDRNEEIIVSGAQGKDVSDYSSMMSKVFGEIYRVLKPEAVATVVFHSASSSVWRALSTAYGTAGFGVRATSVLDKLQASFKQVVSSVSVKGDPLILLSKCADRASGPAKSTDDVIEEIFRTSESGSAPERDRQRLYSRFVSRCLELGMEVEMGAKEFYDRADSALRN